MSTKLFRGALVAAVLIAGCSVAPTTPELTQEESAFLSSTAVSARYKAMAGEGAMFSTAAVRAPKLQGVTVTASSTRSEYFRLAFATDGKPTTAWGPAATDRNPTLTFNLAGCYNLTGFATKVDAGTVIDVQVREGDGAWTTIATGLDPQDAVMDYMTLDGSQATEARLSFRSTNGKPVLVCEVEWFGTPCVVTSPSPTPTPVPTPTPTPVPTPTVTPTVPPHEDHCGCKVTGGGFTFLPDGTRVNFGFNAQHDKDGGAKGNVNVVVHAKPNVHFKTDTITEVTCDIDPASVFPKLTGSATIKGTLKSGEAFVLVVTDVGEPGVLDNFKLTVAGNLIVDLDLAGDRSGGGNIQLHKEKCD